MEVDVEAVDLEARTAQNAGGPVQRSVETPLVGEEAIVWETGDTDWDLVERNCRRENDLARAREDKALRADYEADRAILIEERQKALTAYNDLVQKLLLARRHLDDCQADVDWLADEHHKRVEALTGERRANDGAIQEWIASGRRMQDASHTLATREDDWGAPRGAHDTRGAPDSRLGGGRVEVYHADGTFVGALMSIPPPNRWVQILLSRPIVRSVQVRHGRNITQTHLNALCTSSDTKRSKWLAFFIQATGSLQHRACDTCAKGQGLFSLCVIVGGADLPRCGNCEWNKHACTGASGVVNLKLSRPGSLHVLPTEPSSANKADSASAPRALLPTTSETAEGAGGGERAEKARRPSLVEAHRNPVEVVVQQPLPMSVAPLQQTGADQQGSNSRSPKSETPEDGDLHLKITLRTLSLKDDGLIFLEPEIMYGVPLRKIAPGDAYWQPTWNPIEASIQSKLDWWTAKLSGLKSVGDEALTDRDRTAIFQAGRQVNRGKATLKFLATSNFHPFQLVGKRWITSSLAHYDTLFRMVTTLTELAKFHLDVTPLQWLRQRLHEMYETSPATFKLDRVVAKLYHDPKLSYLRLSNGFGNIGRPQVNPRASLGEETLRLLAGEKRKSTSLLSDYGTPTSAKRAAPAESDRRRGTATPSTPVTPSKATASGNALPQRPLLPPASLSSLPPPLPAVQKPPPTLPSSKRRDSHHLHPYQHRHAQQRQYGKGGSSLASRRAAGGDDDDDDDDGLAYAGYTSTDSLTHDTVIRKDWRVYQVKTAQLTTNPQTTQYWHWVDEKHANGSGGSSRGGRDDFEAMFEHQVLKETEPATSWGVFKEPIDFHLRLRELTTITYAKSSRIVVIGTRPVDGIDERGNVLALFKRERTKRRFLCFMRKKGIGLVQAPSHEVEAEWNCLQSDVMPGAESDSGS